MDYENIYLETLKEVMTLRRKMRALQVKETLAKLANVTAKTHRLQSLENKLQEELSTHNRGERIDTLIEIIQDML